MSMTGRTDDQTRRLSTADLARAARRQDAERPGIDESIPAPLDYAEEDEVSRLDVAEVPGAKAASRRAGEEFANDARNGDILDEDIDADVVADAKADRSHEGRTPIEALEPLFTGELADSFRTRWTSIQGSFVDDPREAVRRGDELVAEVMSNLADSFAGERQRMEAQLGATGDSATENLRVALRRYRSFFERLLEL